MTAITCTADLKRLPIWVVFEMVPQPDGKKPKKIPYTPGTNREARVNDPTTWGTYDEAVADAERTGRLPGVTLTPPMNLTLIDKDGHIDDKANELVERFDSYSERSVNGGLHILVRGRPPEGFKAPPGIEVYPRTGNRFLVLTEDIIDGRDRIEERTELLARLAPARPKPAPRQSAGEALSVDDRVVIERVLLMRKGRQLHADGDWTGYHSGSEGDLGLLNCYISAGAKGEDQLNRLFLQSALYQARKASWDTAHYRKRTLATAMNGDVDVWEGWTQQAKDGGTSTSELPTGDASELLQRIAALEMENTQLKADNAALVELINHPVLTHAQIKIAVQAAILPRAKASHGDVDANGDAVISASEQSNDWRPKPVKQEDGVTPRLAPTNQDGTIPRLARSNVRPIMEWAIENELVPAKAIPVQRSHASGAAWHDTAWSITPAQSLADALNPWLNYQANAPKQRKPRTVPEACRECGEVHAIRHEFWCTGCGGRARPDKTVEPHEETGDKLSPVQTAHPGVALVRIGRYVISGLPEQPAYLDAAPDPLEPEPDSWEISYLQSPSRDDDGMAVPPLLFDHTMPWDGEAGADRWTM